MANEFLTTFLDSLTPNRRAVLEKLLQLTTVLPTASEDQLAAEIQNLVTKLDAEATKSLTLEALPQSGITNPINYNTEMQNIFQDLALLYTECNIIDDIIIRHKLLDDSILTSLREGVRILKEKLVKYKRLYLATIGEYTDTFYDTFKDIENIETYNSKTHLYFQNNIPAYIDTVAQIATIQPYFKKSRVLTASGKPIATIKKILQVGSGLSSVSNKGNNSIVNAIDGAINTFWGEVVLTDAPLVHNTNILGNVIPEGALCQIEIDLKQEVTVNEISINPYCYFPLDIVNIWLIGPSISGWQPIPGKRINITSTYSILKSSIEPMIFHFPAHAARKVIILFNQRNYDFNYYSLTRAQTLNIELWRKISENKLRGETNPGVIPSATLTDFRNYDPAYSNYNFISSITAAKAAQLGIGELANLVLTEENKNILQEGIATLRELNNNEKKIVVNKFEYIYGAYEIAINRNFYNRSSALVTKPIIVKGLSTAINLTAKTDDFGNNANQVTWQYTTKTNPKSADMINLTTANDNRIPDGTKENETSQFINYIDKNDGRPGQRFEKTEPDNSITLYSYPYIDVDRINESKIFNPNPIAYRDIYIKLEDVKGQTKIDQDYTDLPFAYDKDETFVAYMEVLEETDATQTQEITGPGTGTTSAVSKVAGSDTETITINKKAGRIFNSKYSRWQSSPEPRIMKKVYTNKDKDVPEGEELLPTTFSGDQRIINFPPLKNLCMKVEYTKRDDTEIIEALETIDTKRVNSYEVSLPGLNKINNIHYYSDIAGSNEIRNNDVSAIDITTLETDEEGNKIVVLYDDKDYFFDILKDSLDITKRANKAKVEYEELISKNKTMSIATDFLETNKYTLADYATTLYGKEYVVLRVNWGLNDEVFNFNNFLSTGEQLSTNDYKLINYPDGMVKVRMRNKGTSWADFNVTKDIYIKDAIILSPIIDNNLSTGEFKVLINKEQILEGLRLWADSPNRIVVPPFIDFPVPDFTVFPDQNIWITNLPNSPNNPTATLWVDSVSFVLADIQSAKNIEAEVDMSIITYPINSLPIIVDGYITEQIMPEENRKYFFDIYITNNEINLPSDLSAENERVKILEKVETTEGSFLLTENTTGGGYILEITKSEDLVTRLIKNKYIVLNYTANPKESIKHFYNEDETKLGQVIIEEDTTTQIIGSIKVNFGELLFDYSFDFDKGLIIFGDTLIDGTTVLAYYHYKDPNKRYTSETFPVPTPIFDNKGYIKNITNYKDKSEFEFRTYNPDPNAENYYPIIEYVHLGNKILFNRPLGENSDIPYNIRVSYKGLEDNIRVIGTLSNNNDNESPIIEEITVKIKSVVD